MKIAIYARVSTSDQNADMQLRELREYCKLRGWQIYKEYVDQESGAVRSRPALNQLMAEAKRRRFDGILVWRFDRFARSTTHLLAGLDACRTAGIDFVSLHEGIDTSTATGRVLFTIIAAIAEFERELIRERVRAGIANARAAGRTLGRPRVLADAKEIARLRAQGLSWENISCSLGIGKGTAQRAFASLPKNPY